MKIALCIPIYEPSDKVLPFLKQFREGDFDAFLVVNDGSDSRFDEIYQRIEEETLFHVVSYEKNHGKGYALRYGFTYLREHVEDLGWIETADGDGQHTYSDILHVKQVAFENPDSLILGSRDIDLPYVPDRSKIGNKLSNAYFLWETNHNLKETQTGLRVIPKKLFTVANRTYGNRFEYELNFLTNSAPVTPFVEVDIETVYEGNNTGSHFRPIHDTVRLYRIPLLTKVLRIACWALELVLFFVFSTFVFQNEGNLTIFASNTGAWYSSYFLFFFLLVFAIYQCKMRITRRQLFLLFYHFATYAITTLLLYLVKDTPLPLTLWKFFFDAALLTLWFIIHIISYKIHLKK